jgi:tetratricopeptide (TPR) repeat protein
MKRSTLIFLAFSFLTIVGCRDVEMATIERAYRWYKRGDYDRAIQQFSAVLSSNPTNLHALAGRGDSFAEKKQYENALKDYDKAIEHHPNHAKLYYHRGVCWQESAVLRGWYDEDKLVKALADYDKSIELDGEYVLPYINRAFINKISSVRLKIE